MPGPRRRGPRWGRLPLRVRLIAGFAAAMLVVLTGAGAFVYLRVRYALDLRLDEDLAAQSTQLTTAARTGTPPAAAARPGPGEYWQLLDATNHVLAASPGLPRGSLLTPDQLDRALHRPVRADRGSLLPISARPLRLYAVPVHAGARPAAGQPAVTVAAVRRDQRDEALRELIGQLALANLAALAVASLVGYRLARAALAPVERYRAEAARIAAGETGVRLAVPATDDEVARLGRTLNDMLTALESALERERQFINDASHELRTPLTLLSTELELALRRPRSTAELEQTLRAAAADTADLIALADTLLALGVPPVPGAAAEVDVGELAAGLTDRYRAGSRADTLRTRITPGLTVRGDPARLGRVVTNLLDNALRYGAPPVTVTVDRADGLVRLMVHDNGPGMDPEFLPHAAERFRRADTARTSPGTGLGLSLVEAIVRAHHGELWICSAGAHHRISAVFAGECRHPAVGTTVTVLLPAAPATG
ncbi:HAMP domain-containing histidine kinase [Micromonospora yasonensis]|uniref:sensor histidine kinase n=1 Tax=Micromonospora yasonensis TaxID=1128667 RepID=UPI00222F256B|nr:HAMP domain-containing sensor histidine kinase [Micromonospora yasonensis]MCW3842537.1 HAMP domain-containing histidine kinase [Micromonospora yasonensis]